MLAWTTLTPSGSFVLGRHFLVESGEHQGADAWRDPPRLRPLPSRKLRLCWRQTGGESAGVDGGDFDNEAASVWAYGVGDLTVHVRSGCRLRCCQNVQKRNATGPTV